MRKRNFSNGIVIVIVILFVGTSSVSSYRIIEIATNNRDILYVGGNGPGNYSSIQDAIDNASDSDTIFVYNGTYEEQISVDKSVVLEGESNVNTVVKGGFSLSENDTTIKHFKITGGYDWYIDETGKNGTCRIGIYTSSSKNVFYNNLIYALGGNGENGWLEDGGAGGTGTGIHLYSSTGNNISRNIISIWAGDGGEGINGGGGNGGNATGIYLYSSANNNIANNTISYISAGYGGRGGFLPIMSKDVGPGGNGGNAVGIYLYSSTYNKIIFNDISNIYAGNGGIGAEVPAGKGGNGLGIEMKSSPSNIIIYNNISTINGGNGESGKRGSSGGDATGIFMETSNSNNISLNDVSFLSGGNGGNSYASYYLGGFGGASSGIFLQSSNSNNISYNDVTYLSGGTGGTGGDAPGGNGGASTGVNLKSSNSNNILFISICNLTGGFGGGVASDGGDASGLSLISSNSNKVTFLTTCYIYGGEGPPYGTNGTGTGICSSSSSYNIIAKCVIMHGDNGMNTFDNSNNNIIYHTNLFNNTVNAHDSCSNKWHNTTLGEGNFWDDYNGTDGDGDGIGDTPYNISGGDNQDLYPLMHPFELYYILNISASSEVDEGTEFNVTIKSIGGTAIPNTTVEFNDELKLTDAGGRVYFTAPMVGEDTFYNITATKDGYTGDSESILVKNVKDDFKTMFILGLIRNLTTEGDYITFEAVNIRCATFQPLEFNAYYSGEEIVVATKYFGFIGVMFIFALCNASIG